MSASLSTLNLDGARIAGAPRELRLAMLRQLAGETVGTTFYGKMLQVARKSALRGKVGHGGRGEDVFGAQLDMELARRAGAAAGKGLSETLYQRLAKRV